MTTQLKQRPGTAVILIAYAAFIALGLMDGLLGVAWPSLRADFEQPLDALGILLLAGTSGHIMASFSNGRLLQSTGVAILLIIALALRGGSFLTQALTPAWWLFVGAGFAGGLGAGLLDAGMNTFAAARFRPRLLNWLHASFAVGTTLGSLLMTGLLSLELSWRVGLGLLAGIHLLLALVFTVSRDRWALAPQTAGSKPATPTRSRDTLKLPMVWLSIAIFALYTGLELGMGQWSFTLATEARGVAETTAGLWTTLYWGSLTAGRIILGFIEANPARLVRWVLLLTISGATLFALNLAPWLSLIGLMAVGFGLAPVFPALIALTPARLGADHAPNAIGFQVGAAGVGAAILPGLAGVLGTAVTLEAISLFFAVTAVLLFILSEIATGQSKNQRPIG